MSSRERSPREVRPFGKEPESALYPSGHSDQNPKGLDVGITCPGRASDARARANRLGAAWWNNLGARHLNEAHILLHLTEAQRRTAATEAGQVPAQTRCASTPATARPTQTWGTSTPISMIHRPRPRHSRRPHAPRPTIGAPSSSWARRWPRWAKRPRRAPRGTVGRRVGLLRPSGRRPARTGSGGTLLNAERGGAADPASAGGYVALGKTLSAQKAYTDAVEIYQTRSRR